MPQGYSYADDYEQYSPYGGLPPMVAFQQQYPGGGQQGGGLDAYMQMMSKFAPNPLLNAGLQFGGSLLGGLVGLFKGKSDEEKLRERRTDEVWNMAKNRMGQSPLNPEQYLADYMRARAPQINQHAESLNRRLNLDSGVAQGELFRQMEGPLAQFMLGAKQRNDEMKFQNDNMLLSLMAQLSGRG